MDLMPIQSGSTEPAPPTEEVDAAGLTGFGEMIAALLAERDPGHAEETPSGPHSGIDPDVGREASDPSTTEPGNTAARPAEDGPAPLPGPTSPAIPRGPHESPTTGMTTRVAVPGLDMALQPGPSGPAGNGTALSTTETGEVGDGTQTGSVHRTSKPGAPGGGASPDISPLAPSGALPAEGWSEAAAPIGARETANEQTPGQGRFPTKASRPGPAATSPAATPTNPTVDSFASVTEAAIDADRMPTADPATGEEPGTAGHEPEPASAIPRTDAERPSPTPKPPVEVQTPEPAGEVPARAPEAQIEVERTAMAEVVDRLREWADRVESARQPDSISLKLADPDGDVLVRLAMRDGRLELNVTRPGGETPSWLADQLDDALARHGFDLSGGDPEAEHANAKWRDDHDEPGRRSGSRTRGHEPDQGEGLWI